MMKYLKIYYRLLVYLTSFTVCSGDIKKCSENDQKTGLFQSFFFSSPDPKSEKKKFRKSTYKKFWPYHVPSKIDYGESVQM